MAHLQKKKETLEEVDAAISSLRALVSSKKGPSTVQSVLNDYREIEGKPLSYKKYGYPNADEFLKSTNQFVVQNNMGESMVFVKPNKESVHILKMVAAQKCTKTKKSGFAILRHPSKKTVGSNWNPSAYTKMYSQMPSQTSRFTPKYQIRNNNLNQPTRPFYQNNTNYNKYSNNNHNSRNNYPINNSNNNAQSKQTVSLKTVPTNQNIQQNYQNNRFNRSEANNNNSTTKNLNKSQLSPIKAGQQPLASNDLRHKISEKQSSQQTTQTQQQQRQLSSIELRNCSNRQNHADADTENDLNCGAMQSKYVARETVQNTVCDVVNVNQTCNNTLQQSGRSVNSRLHIIKDIAALSSTPSINVLQFCNSNTTKCVSQDSTLHEPVAQIPPVIPQTIQLPTLPGRMTLQDRLKINQQVGSADLEKVSKVVTPQSPPPKTPDFGFKTLLSSVAPSTESKQTPTKAPFSWNQPQATPVELLAQYAEHNGFSRPTYEYFKLKNTRIQCRVKINGLTYTTYPNDYTNVFEGQFAAAQNAIENIKLKEDLSNYSECFDSDYEIATKIYDLLVSCSNGMFSNYIPDAFRNTHGTLLPNHWEFIILAHSSMFSKEDVNGKTIVFANTPDDCGSNGSTASITSEAKCMSANILTLPWKDQYWNIYVTNPVSTVEIWGRLVGSEYSDQMDALSTNIEIAMMGENKLKPKTISVGEYYLVCITDCWYRVRTEQIDFEINNCVCFFIDLGEWERVPLDEIYVCDSNYLELPGQSICFTLDGLEDFGENPKAKSHLDNLISGKVCIAEILTTKEEFDKTNDNTFSDVRIRVILYDTSSEEDINLNSIILKHVCDDTPVPELSRKVLTTVCITHVDDYGMVYCQLKDAAMVYIQKLINNLVQSNALEGKHRGLYRSKATAGQQLYLVQDEEDKKWHRASFVSEESGPYCKMLFVDIGLKKSVNVSNIYRLESLSVALSRYPAQAVRVKLFDIPDINDYLLSRLQALLIPGLTAMIKVITYSSVPLVKVYMHLEQNNILVCVNDSIRSEMELEINSEIISDPRIMSALESSSNSIEAAELSQSFSAMNIEQKKVINSKSNKLPRLSIKIEELFDVVVILASNPNFFVVQPYSQTLQLNQMMVQLQEYCTRKAQLIAKTGVLEGEVYAGLDSDDLNWYRVFVVKILGGPSSIHVYFCDFGRVRILDSDSLRILPPEFRKLPQQAVTAKLHGVMPLNGDWSAEDAIRFQELTVNKKFASIVRSIKEDELNQHDEIVELTLIDVSTDEDILVHQILVDEKRARMNE